MKPKDLKYPFCWDQRQPILKDNVFYVPDYYFKHHEWEGKFPLAPKMIIEFCSGNGEWILQKAIDHPDALWIAVEKDFERVRKIVSKRNNRAVENLLVVSGYAEPFVEHYLPEGVIDQVFVNFPDPWPKDRHAKNRIFKQPFIDHVRRVMKPEGLATLVTDDLTYLQQMELEMGKAFTLQTRDPIPNYGSSFFERLWVEKGRNINFLRYTPHAHV